MNLRASNSEGAVESLLELWLRKFGWWLLIFVLSLLSPLYVFVIGYVIGYVLPSRLVGLFMYAGFAWPQIALSPIAVVENATGDYILREGHWFLIACAGWLVIGTIHALVAMRQRRSRFVLSVLPVAVIVALLVKAVIEFTYDVSFVIDLI